MRKLLTLILAIAIAVPMIAQERGKGRFNPEEYKAKLEAYVTQRAGFTASEAQAFFPLYHEMKEKQRDIMQKVQKLKRNHPAENASTKEYLNVVTQIESLNVQAAKTEETYYKKLCKVVSAKKVYAAMLAEDAFHREMLQNMRPGNKGPRHGGQGKGQADRAKK